MHPKRRWLILVRLLCCLMLIVNPALLLVVVAQENTPEACLPPTFLIGSELEVIGSVDAGGLPIRADVGLDEPVIGTLPLGTRLVLRQYAGCVEGRNWFQFDNVLSNGEHIWSYIAGDDGVNYWLQSVRFCPDQAYLTLSDVQGYSTIQAAYPTENGFLIGVSRGEVAHPVSLTYYAIDGVTGMLTPAEYPYAGIVTHELTDRLGITNLIFGDISYDDDRLTVSPDGTKILYFVLMPDEGVEAFIANADGRSQRSLGRVPFGISIANVHWGADGRLYLMVVSEEGGAYGTVSFCLTDNCTVEGRISDVAAAYGALVSDSSIVTTSPDGRYLAINPLIMGWFNDTQRSLPTIIDLNEHRVITLPDNGSSAVPLLWIDNNHIAFAVSGASVTDSTPYEAAGMSINLTGG